MSMQQETRTDDTAENDGAPAPGGSAEDVKARLQKELERSYDLLPKILAQITQENAASQAALNRLHTLFDKIYDCEKELGENPEKLSLARIYELAAQGGGDPEKMEELLAANRAFEQENDILSRTIESLAFQIDSMKKKAADELVLDGKLQKPPLEQVRSLMKSMEKILEQAQIIAVSETGGESAAGARPLDERLAEDMAGLEQISAAALESAPKHTTLLGRMIRRFGLAYDSKDVYTVRRLLLAFAKANREQARLIDTLRPVHEHMAKIHGIMELMETMGNGDVRKHPDYLDALKEIGNLRELAERHKAAGEACRTAGRNLEDIEADIQEKTEMRGQIEKWIAELKKEEQEKLSKIRLLAENIAALEEETKKKGATASQQEKEGAQTAAGSGENGSADVNLLKEKLEKLQEQKEKDRKTIAELEGRISAFENNLLVDKLLNEIGLLRETLGKKEEEITKAQQEKEAMDTRMGLWVGNEAALQKQAGEWRKKALKKYAFTFGPLATAFAAAAGVSALAGFNAASYLTTNSFDTGALITGAVFAVPGAFMGYRLFIDTPFLLKTWTAACSGLAFSMIGTIPFLIAQAIGNTNDLNKCEGKLCITEHYKDSDGVDGRRLTTLDELSPEMKARFLPDMDDACEKKPCIIQHYKDEDGNDRRRMVPLDKLTPETKAQLLINFSGMKKDRFAPPRITLSPVRKRYAPRP